ncbi:hypothetical protein DNTS_016109 [Danionella cerebrum]|uniref:Tudor domain-containing protein n=1 Tax=Danionella cerebrum TaxID=2873325 RepID=A0A553Q689_9TELE|nr:hypothetical protein DNTS_016109 [Danionella translucida]
MLTFSKSSKGDVARKEVVQNCGDAPSAQQIAGSVMSQHVKMCNYCGHPACQSQDWIAHRHTCKPSVPELARVEAEEPKVKPCGNGLGAQPKVICTDIQPKRMYRKDLQKHGISKGAEIQGTVIDLKNPGLFIIYWQTEEMIQSLKKISADLQKAHGNTFAPEYKPEIGEICAAKFSVDQSWYRAEIQSFDVARKTAGVFYIDFGNEENVTLDNMQPLSEHIGAAPAFALKCCVAGVKPLTGTWTGECSFSVKRLIVGKTLSITVKDIINDGDLFAVDFPLGTFGKNISTYLVEQQYAIKEDAPVNSLNEQGINSLLTASFENFKRLSKGKNENSDARPPEPLIQGVGDSFMAVVTHLQSPYEILCQKLENAHIIEQLQRKLREHCSNASASEDFRPAPGTVCCSLFSEDKQWYRAKVLAYSSEEVVCVGYIDFGNSEEVGLNHLRPISQDLLTLSTQAIPCSLAGIKSATDTWPDEAIQCLKRLVCNRFIRVEILGQKDSKALVSMIDESSDPQASIAEQLINMGYATAAIENEPVQASVPEMPPLDPSDKKLEWTSVELPNDGQKVSLVISSMKSLDEFYCHFYRKADEHLLTELSVELTKHCEEERALTSPNVGQPCCALFTGDAQWYRALILKVSENDKVLVYFVDFGNSCEVDRAHLKSITQTLLKVPFQAIRCWLSGVEPVEGRWNKEAVTKFQTLCAGQTLSGIVKSTNEKGYGVELACDGLSVGDVLISEHLAKPFGQVKQLPVQPTKSNQAEDLSVLVDKDQITPVKEPLKAKQEVDRTPEDTCASSSSFPLNWKTLKLSCKDSFQPRVAAVISPSLFYIMNPGQVNVESLNTVKVDVEKHCRKQQVPSQCHPLPGAACCAQFSGDKNWYRAVVLEVTSKHAHIIYADYGNMETVSLSSILPITKELLQHPFQIVRCALAGKEHFPGVWPGEVLELFGIQVNGGILATLQGFDGTSNLLSLTNQSGQVDINAIVLGALQRGLIKSDAKQPEIIIEDKKDSNKSDVENACSSQVPGQTPTANIEKPAPKDQVPPVNGITMVEEPENVSKTENTMECPEPHDATSLKASTVSSCCCVELKQKVDHIEELILFLVQKFGSQK